VTALPDGRALAVWLATNPNTGEADIYGRILDPGGFPLGQDFLINSAVGLGEAAPHAATLPDGRVVVTWTSYDPSLNSDDIHARMLSFNTILDGTPGDDRIVGTNDNDVIHAGAGRDLAYGALGNDVVYGGTGNDSLLGEDGNDFLFGEDGDDRLWGGYSNDTFVGGAGADNFAGGAGVDTVRYETSPTGVYVDLAHNGTGGDAAGDSFSSIENLIGSRFATR
jgi:Ca2+-binding RTX toxin-like protein